MNVTYGIEIEDHHDDRYISVAEKALEGMAKAAHPGAFLVDVFPLRTSYIRTSCITSRTKLDDDSEIRSGVDAFRYLQEAGQRMEEGGHGDERRSLRYRQECFGESPLPVLMDYLTSEVF